MGVKATRLVGEDMIPKKVSQLENDKKYQTEEEVNRKIPKTLPASDVYEWAKQPKKPTYTKEEIGLGYVSSSDINQISYNKRDIEVLYKRANLNAEDILNVKEIANNAVNIANGRLKAKVFNNFAEMTNYLKNASVTEFGLGDNLFIKDSNVPDYWISNILNYNGGVYGYYEITELEAKTDLTDYYNKSEIDAKETNINNKINEKANSTDVYDKTYIDTKEQELKDEIETKANSTDVYTKEEIDEYKQSIGQYNAGIIVPTSGYVSRIYFNKSLMSMSLEKINNYIDSLDINFDNLGYYYVAKAVSDVNGTITITIRKQINENNEYYFEIKKTTFYVGSSTGIVTTILDKYGWNTNASDLLVAISDLTASDGGIDYGTQNEKVISLFSLNKYFDLPDLVSKVDNVEKRVNKNLQDIKEIEDIAKEALEKANQGGSGGGSVTPENVYTKEEVDTKINYITNIIGEYPLAKPIKSNEYIENIYVNTSLTKEEVYYIVKNSNLEWENYSETENRCILHNSGDGSSFISLIEKNNFEEVRLSCAIEEEENTIYSMRIFDVDKFTYEFINKYNGIIPINDTNYIKNDKGLESIVGLIATSPIENKLQLAPQVKKNIENININKNNINEIENNINEIENDIKNLGYYNSFVPKEGFIEKVYLNIFLPKEKIVELLSTLDFSTNPHYTIVKSRSGKYEIYVLQYNDGSIEIKFDYPTESGSTYRDTLFYPIVNNYKETNGFNMELIGEDGSVVFNEESYPYTTYPYANEQLVDIFSTKPFNDNNLVNKVRNLEYGLENTYTKEEIDKLQHKLGELDFAQPIRENEYVEKIYVNTSLTYEEIAEIIDSLEMPDGKTTYYLYTSKDYTKNIFLDTDTPYSIRYYQKDIGYSYIYMNKSFTEDFINNTNGIIEINAENQLSEEVTEFIQNKKLTRLFSTTPVFGLSSLEEKIDNLGQIKANKSEVYTKLEVDGKIEEINGQLVLKANSSDVYTRTEINNLLANFSSLDIEVVTTLPTTNISTTTIYLKPLTTSATQNVYEEYIYINNKWELIGTTQVDLSNYYKKTETYSKSEVDNKVNSKVEVSTFNEVLQGATQEIININKKVVDVEQRIDVGSVTENGAIPNSGTLDTLYINTSMSTSEVNALIDQVGTYYSQLGGRLYMALQNADGDRMIAMISSGTSYQIMANLTGSLATIYDNGWILNRLPEGYEDGIYIGSELVSNSSAIGFSTTVGHKNSQLIDLFYTKVSKPIPINEEVKNNTNEIKKLDKQLNAKVAGSGGGGDAIPNSGYVDTVYINTNLSTEQVLDIIALDKLDYILLGEEETGEKMYAYFVLGTEPTTPETVEDGFDTMIGIMLFTDSDDNIFSAQIMGNVVPTSEEDDGSRVIWYYDIEMGGGMFDPQGIGVSEFIVQGEAMTEAMGMSAGTSNDKLVDLMNIGATSGSAKSFYEKMNELYDYVGQVKSGATTVPNSGTVEKIYFNTSLSVDEVVSIISQLSYVEVSEMNNVPLYGIIVSENNGNTIFIMNMMGYYLIANYDTNDFYFVSDTLPEEAGMPLDFVGWNPNFNGEIVIQDSVVDDFIGYPFGKENDKITKLVSLTPSFEKPKTLVERVENIEKKCEDIAVPVHKFIQKEYVVEELPLNEVDERVISLTSDTLINISSATENDEPVAIYLNGYKAFINFVYTRKFITFYRQDLEDANNFDGNPNDVSLYGEFYNEILNAICPTTMIIEDYFAYSYLVYYHNECWIMKRVRYGEC